MKFNVYVNVELAVNIEVEADNADEAKDTVRKMVKEDLIDIEDDYDIESISIEAEEDD